MSEIVQGVIVYQALQCLIPAVVIAGLVGVYFLVEWLSNR